MKLLNTKSIVLSIVATVFTFASVQSEARQQRRAISPERVINMSYNISDRLEQEAHNLTRSELTEIRDSLRQIRNTLNGIGNPVDPIGPATYSSTCVALSTNVYGQTTTRTMGERKGTIKKIISDCKFLATSEFGANAKIRINNLKLINTGSALETATCVIKKTNVYGQTTTQTIGKIASGSIQELKADCNLLAKEVYGTEGRSSLSGISSL